MTTQQTATQTTTQQATATNETFATFLHKVLSGTAVAIIVAVIPNAILASIFRLFPDIPAAVDYLRILQVFQFFTPVMAGFLIAANFKLKPMEQLAVGGAAYIGSGAWVFKKVVDQGAEVGLFQLRGIGDLINMMITAALAVLVLRWLGNRLGSLAIVLVPIFVGTGVGYVGWVLLPYVSKVTTYIGEMINTFTTLQPFLMSVLIAISFAILIVNPISTVAIGIAIGLNGLSAGAAAMGVAATTVYLIVATARTNKVGVPTAIALGAMKMMMPNYLANPVMNIPIVVTAAVSALSVPLLQIMGTPNSAGFGLVGMVGPIASLESPTMNLVWLLVAWIVVPAVVSFVAHHACLKTLKSYNPAIFVFEG